MGILYCQTAGPADNLTPGLLVKLPPSPGHSQPFQVLCGLTPQLHTAGWEVGPWKQVSVLVLKVPQGTLLWSPFGVQTE